MPATAEAAPLPLATTVDSTSRRIKMSSVEKPRVIELKAAGKTRKFISRQLNQECSLRSVEKMYSGRTALRSRAVSGASFDAVSTPAGAYPEVDPRLSVWCPAMRSRGRKFVPPSLAILQCKEIQIAAALGVVNVLASNAILENWAGRLGWVNVAQHGCGASANVAEASPRMGETRCLMTRVDPDLI